MARDFDFGRWQKEVRNRAVQALGSTLELEGDGKVRFLLNDKALRSLLAHYDIYEQLNPQQGEAIQRRLREDVEATRRWMALLDSTQVPVGERYEQQLLFMQNLAGDHLENSIKAAYVPIHNEELRRGKTWDQHVVPNDSCYDDFHFVAL